MMNQAYPVPSEDLLAEWEAEVAHTTIDEIGHVAKRAAEWGYQQCWNTCVAAATGVSLGGEGANG